MTWWAVWLAMQSGLFVFYFVLGNQPANAASANPAMLAVGVMQVLGSAIVRWGLLPRLTEAPKAFPLFVVGLALAEGACFSGIFLAPAYKQELFIASILGVGQFVPFFAAKFDEPTRR